MSGSDLHEKAADLQGLIKAASWIADDASTNPNAKHGLVAILNVAERLAEEICDGADKVTLDHKARDLAESGVSHGG